jgi:hypothetical protein
MASFKLDRTAFKAQTKVQAANHSIFYQKLTWKERLRITYYLNSVAYGFDENNPPRINRQHFTAKSLRGNG